MSPEVLTEIKSEKIQQIKGEIFKINSKELLNELDYLEGYPNLYLREFIKVKLHKNPRLLPK